MRKTALTLASFATLLCLAQSDAPESLMYQDQKIYVVVAVLSIVFIFIFAYLLRLDRKINKLK